MIAAAKTRGRIVAVILPVRCDNGTTLLISRTPHNTRYFRLKPLAPLSCQSSMRFTGSICALLAAVPLGAQGNHPALGSRVDSLFAQWRAPASPGCAIGVTHRGRVVLERAYGMADVESGAPMT